MLGAMILGFGFAACKKDDDGDSGSTTKTLDKTKLVDKDWWNQGSTILMRFNSNGTFGSVASNKWNWVNNSDTVFIDFQSLPDQTWVIEWTEDTEASFRLKGSTGGTLFKTSKW